MSSASIPRSVRMEAAQADPDTVFTPGQKKAVRQAINYCSVVDPSIADLSRLQARVEGGYVLTKKDRRRLQNVLNKFGAQNLTRSERRINSWAKSALWDAHRPRGDSR